MLEYIFANAERNFGPGCQIKPSVTKVCHCQSPLNRSNILTENKHSQHGWSGLELPYIKIQGREGGRLWLELGRLVGIKLGWLGWLELELPYIKIRGREGGRLWLELGRLVGTVSWDG